jgi:hypothetical protein
MDIFYVPIISFLAALIVGYILGSMGIEIKLPEWGAAKVNNNDWADKYLTIGKPIGPPNTKLNGDPLDRTIKAAKDNAGALR